MTLCGPRRRVCAHSARSPRRHIASAPTAATTTRDRSEPSTKNRTYTAARLCWTPSANRWRISQPVLPRPNDANITNTSEFGSKTLQIRIAVDAMGGDHAPSVVVDGAVAAARHLDAGIDLVGRTADVERALSVYPDWRVAGDRSRRRARRHRDGGVSGVSRPTQASLIGAGRCRPRRQTRGCGSRERRAHRSHRAVGSCRVRHGCRRRSSGTGHDDSRRDAIPPCCSTRARMWNAGLSTSCSLP